MHLAATIASMVFCSCTLKLPDPVSILLVTWKKHIKQRRIGHISCRKQVMSIIVLYICTWPSAIISKTWYCPPFCTTMSMAASMIGAKDVGPRNIFNLRNLLSFDCILDKTLILFWFKLQKMMHRSIFARTWHS